MKNFMLFLLASIVLTSCSQKVRTNEMEPEAFTVEEAKEIINKYGLDESSFKFMPNEYVEGSKNKQELIKDFEILVKGIAEYNNSQEGKIAREINEFEMKARIENLSKTEIYNFFVEIDKKYGTDFRNFAIENPNSNTKNEQRGSSNRDYLNQSSSK